MAIKAKSKTSKDKVFTVPDSKPKTATAALAGQTYSTQKPTASYAVAYKGPGSSYDQNTPAYSAPVSTAPKSLRELFKSSVRWVKNASKKQAPDGLMSYCLTGACREIYGNDSVKHAEVIKKLNSVINAYTLTPTPYTGYGDGNVVGFNDKQDTSFLDIQRVVALADV